MGENKALKAQKIGKCISYNRSVDIRFKKKAFLNIRRKGKHKNDIRENRYHL